MMDSCDTLRVVDSSNRLTDHYEALTSIAFDNDAGNFFVTGSRDGVVRLWEGDNDRPQDVPMCVVTMPIHTRSAVNSVAIWSDSAVFMASGSDDKTVKLCKVTPNRREFIATLNKHTASVNSVAFHHRLYLLVSGSSDRTIRLWRYDPNNINDSNVECISVLEGHSAPVHSVAFHPRLNILASGSDAVRLYNFNSNGNASDAIAFTNDNGKNGHREEVTCVAFHPQFDTMATCSAEDNTVKLWEVTSSGHVNCFETLRGDDDLQYESVVFHPMEPFMLTGGKHTEAAKLWRFTPSGREFSSSVIMVAKRRDGHIVLGRHAETLAFHPFNNVLVIGNYWSSYSLDNLNAAIDKAHAVDERYRGSPQPVAQPVAPPVAQPVAPPVAQPVAQPLAPPVITAQDRRDQMIDDLRAAEAKAGGLTNMSREDVLAVIPNSSSWPTDLRDNFYDGKQIAQMKRMTDEELELTVREFFGDELEKKLKNQERAKRYIQIAIDCLKEMCNDP